MSIEDLAFEFNCPECGFTNSATLKQVRLEEDVICDGCLSTVQLRDDSGSTKRTVDNIERAFDDMKDAFRNLR